MPTAQNPQRDEILDQLTKISETERLKKAPLLSALLRLLVESSLDPEWLGFSAKELSSKYYALRRTTRKSVAASDAGQEHDRLLAAVRKAVSTLRDRLRTYYNDHPGETIIVEIRGQAPYMAEFRKRGENGGIEPAPTVGVPAHCQHLGDNEKGVQYVVEKMADAALWRVRDTHVRLEKGHSRYKPETMASLKDALERFLGRARPGQFEIVAGYSVDSDYVASIVAPSRSSKAAKAWRLHRSGPLMNFTILDYSRDGHNSSEVLFGWGRHDPNPGEAVFLSANRALLGEFQRLYEILQSEDLSEKVLMNSLLRPAEPTWLTDAEFLAKEVGVPDGSEIWIASHNLANVGDEMASFAESVRKHHQKQRQPWCSVSVCVSRRGAR